jgi:hypothetical protein
MKLVELFKNGNRILVRKDQVQEYEKNGYSNKKEEIKEEIKIEEIKIEKQEKQEKQENKELKENKRNKKNDENRN